MTLLVIASYEPQMTKENEERIHAAITRSGVRWGERSSFGDQEFPVYSPVEWLSHEDDTDTELTIYMGDDMERAARLAAELRFCGMTVNIRHDEDEDDE